MTFKTKNTIIRVIYIALIAVIGFFVSVLTEEKYYIWAALLAIAGIFLAVLELMEIPAPLPLMKDQHTLNDWVVKEIVDKETVQKISGRLQELQGKLNFDSQYDVHITFHLAIRALHEKVYAFRGGKIHSDWILVQITDYVGNRKRGKNRAVSTHKGIVGRSFRTQRPHSVNFDSGDGYFKRMTEEFGFSLDEASYHSTDARSYYCLPLGEAGESPYGILYLYSTKNNFFNDALIASKSNDCSAACGDIANLLANDSLVLEARSS